MASLQRSCAPGADPEDSWWVITVAPGKTAVAVALRGQCPTTTVGDGSGYSSQRTVSTTTAEEQKSESAGEKAQGTDSLRPSTTLKTNAPEMTTLTHLLCHCVLIISNEGSAPTTVALRIKSQRDSSAVTSASALAEAWVWHPASTPGVHNCL